VHYRGGATRLIIGPRCELREGVTMNTGTEMGGGITEVGAGCLFMVGAHVGHDCHVGNAVMFANNATLGGHVSVGDYAFLGGLSAVHQNVRVGEGVMVAGVSGVRRNVIPFATALGQDADLVGLNVVGLQRRGATRGQLRQLRRAYRTLFFGDGIFADRLDIVAKESGADALVEKVIAFIRAGGKRPLMQPARQQRSHDRRDDDA
jgi:UDP-N-acetylglucosamine acyltransferase